MHIGKNVLEGFVVLYTIWMLAHFMIACITVFETKLDWTSGMMTEIFFYMEYFYE